MMGASSGSMDTQPAVYISHGSPMVALDREGDYARALRGFASEVRPRAILVVSAHWEAPAPPRVTSAPRPATIHDFAGFPDPLYRLAYRCPGAPDLAEAVTRALRSERIDAAPDPARGLDHGAWVPLSLAFPAAEIPVVELSLPVPRTPQDLLSVGRALAPLREDGVLLVGSGGVVHNLGRVVFEDRDAPVDSWAREFDAWVWGRLRERDDDGIAAYRSRAPHAREAVPTSEHFDPIFFVLGAAGGGDRPIPIYEGFEHANLSMRCFALRS
jgi:4,5-DOPA dioxygenase extradiol